MSDVINLMLQSQPMSPLGKTTWKLACDCGWTAYRQAQFMRQGARCPECACAITQEVFQHTATRKDKDHGL